MPIFDTYKKRDTSRAMAGPAGRALNPPGVPIQALMDKETFLRRFRQVGRGTPNAETINEISDQIASLLKHFHAPGQETKTGDEDKQYSFLQNIDHLIYKWARLSEIPKSKMRSHPNLALMFDLMDEVADERRALLKKFTGRLGPTQLPFSEFLRAWPVPHQGLKAFHSQGQRFYEKVLESNILDSTLRGSPISLQNEASPATPATADDTPAHKNFDMTGFALIHQLIQLPAGRDILEELMEIERVDRKKADVVPTLMEINGITPDAEYSSPWVELENYGQKEHGLSTYKMTVDSRMRSGDFMVNAGMRPGLFSDTQLVSLYPTVLQHALAVTSALARRRGLTDDSTIAPYVMGKENALRRDMGLPERSDYDFHQLVKRQPEE
ncbi:hypothetical protein FUAX_28980 [Fulvitalea axinellae]|uniref:Uncharacterized protein n=1 Tax=Fulvitalea axinellae TaxID=1182444 RepID=A0AAU9DBI2_9BACT|nr:hypothetical protein FUAX_28980 [Fulvitalea axinellae]